MHKKTFENALKFDLFIIKNRFISLIFHGRNRDFLDSLVEEKFNVIFDLQIDLFCITENRLVNNKFQTFKEMFQNYL